MREEIARRIATVQHLREFSLIASLLVGSASLESLRPRFEQRCRALGIVAMSLGLFATPGTADDECLCIAAYGDDRHFEAPRTFASSDFGPSDVLSGVSAPVLVQPLLYDREPLGLVTIAWAAYLRRFTSKWRKSSAQDSKDSEPPSSSERWRSPAPDRRGSVA